MKATVTAKGQITLPAQLRRKLGLNPGTVLEFEEDSSMVRARKVVQRKDPRSTIGCLRDTMSETVEEYLNDVRGPVELAPNSDG